MNDAHLHLTFNHLPIIIPIVGLLIMLGGILLKSDVVKRTSYAIFIFGALLTVPTFLTGEGAEEIVEEIVGVTHHIIHEHEEVAWTFALLSYFLGGVALIGLWSNWKRKPLSKVSTYITAVLSLVVIFMGRQTGTTGGEIIHTEIRENESSIHRSGEAESDELKEGED